MAKKVQTEHKAADKLDTAYAEQVSKLQELQVKCYETEVPAVLAEFEKLERSRIAAVASALQAFLDLERRLPHVCVCLCVVVFVVFVVFVERLFPSGG